MLSPDTRAEFGSSLAAMQAYYRKELGNGELQRMPLGQSRCISGTHRAGCQLVVDGRSGLCVGAQPQAPCEREAQRGRAASPLPFRCESSTVDGIRQTILYSIFAHVEIALDRLICNSRLAIRTLSIQDLHIATLVIRRWGYSSSRLLCLRCT